MLERELSRNGRWKKCVAILTVFVVVVTSYMLALPGITWQRTIICEQVEHQHEAECYMEAEVCICDDELCQHTEDCFVHAEKPEEEDLEALLAEHEHDVDCYRNVIILDCNSKDPEHVHDESCFREGEALVCPEAERMQREENEKEICSLKERISELDEAECEEEIQQLQEEIKGIEECREVIYVLKCENKEHIHSDECFDAPPAEDAGYTCGEIAHEHSQEQHCYNGDGTLRCTLEEHQHTEECLPAKKQENVKQCEDCKEDSKEKIEVEKKEDEQRKDRKEQQKEEVPEKEVVKEADVDDFRVEAETRDGIKVTVSGDRKALPENADHLELDADNVSDETMLEDIGKIQEEEGINLEERQLITISLKCNGEEISLQEDISVTVENFETEDAQLYEVDTEKNAIQVVGQSTARGILKAEVSELGLMMVGAPLLGAPVSELVYQKVNTIEDGATYVIVKEGTNGKYALNMTNGDIYNGARVALGINRRADGYYDISNLDDSSKWKTTSAEAGTFTVKNVGMNKELIIHDDNGYVSYSGVKFNFNYGNSLWSLQQTTIYSQWYKKELYFADNGWGGFWAIPTRNDIFTIYKEIGKEKASYRLAITEDTGTAVTVKRNGQSISDGAVLSDGDILTITVTGGSVKVNGQTFTSGKTYTVDGGDVAIVSTSSAEPLPGQLKDHKAEVLERKNVFSKNDILGEYAIAYHSGGIDKGDGTMQDSFARAGALARNDDVIFDDANNRLYGEDIQVWTIEDAGGIYVYIRDENGYLFLNANGFSYKQSKDQASKFAVEYIWYNTFTLRAGYSDCINSSGGEAAFIPFYMGDPLCIYKPVENSSSAPIVWLDGTDGGIMNLHGSENVNYSSHLKKQSEGIYSLTLPETWKSPDSCSYRLVGWYDVVNSKYYLPGETVEVAKNTVFYADWMNSTYDVGRANSEVIRETDKDAAANNFVHTYVFDYSVMYNVMSEEVKCIVAEDSHRESWKQQTEGKNKYTGLTPMKFMFVDYDFGQQISTYSDKDTDNTNYGYDNTQGILTRVPGLNGRSLLTTLFDPASDFYGENKTADGVIGVNYVGEGDNLYHYMDATSTYNHNYDGEHNGYYYMDSIRNAASYNQSDGRFYVYNYLESTTDSQKDVKDSADPNKYTDFLPFNSPYVSVPGMNVQQTNVSQLGNKKMYTFNAKDKGTGTGEGYIPGNVVANYFFGFRSDIDFTLNYPAGDSRNKNPFGEDITFEFAGDDDVWVFVDGMLVLDIGGLHGVNSGIINFTTGKVYIDDTKDGVQNPTVHDLSDYVGNVQAGDHTVNFYYMERGSSQSNCRVYFDLPETTETAVHAEKNWSDGSMVDHSEDEVTVALLQNGKQIKTAVLNQKNGWKYDFTHLPMRDSKGNVYRYTVEEIEAGGYIPTYEESDSYIQIEVTNSDGTKEKRKAKVTTVTNRPGQELPQTGGGGTVLIYVLGILFIAAGGVGLNLISRRQERGLNKLP